MVYKAAKPTVAMGQTNKIVAAIATLQPNTVHTTTVTQKKCLTQEHNGNINWDCFSNLIYSGLKWELTFPKQEKCQVQSRNALKSF